MRLDQQRDGRHLGSERLLFLSLGCRRVTGELEEVSAFVAVEPKRRGEGVEHLVRGADVPALFEVGVPGGADPGEQCEFLAAESRRPAATGLRQTDLAGVIRSLRLRRKALSSRR